MKDLIVVDFDKTLIPFDSFRKYLLIWIRHYPFFISRLILLRKIRVITLKEMKESLILKIKNHKKFSRINFSFAEYLVNKIDHQLLEEIKKKSKPETVVVLVSASPDEYISMLTEKIGFFAKGSHFDNGIYIHLYKEGKIRFIKRYFSTEKYNFVYAISDSITDLPLLRMFQEHKLLVK